MAMPADHRLTIVVPAVVPAGRTILTFTPERETLKSDPGDTPEYLRRKALEEQSIEFINRNAERLNREMEDVLKYQVDIFDLIPPYHSS